MKTTTTTLQTVLLIALTILFSTKVAPAIIERGVDNASNEVVSFNADEVVGEDNIDLSELDRALRELGF